MPADSRALAQLLRLGSAPREDALLQAQMAQAAQAAQPRGRVYGTAGGAIMGGLGDAIREMGGGFRQNDLARQAKEAMAGEVDARQQWLTADAQKRAAARAALLRGQTPPADAMPLEQSPQEQAAGMAAALRGQAVAQDIAKSAPGGGMAGMGGPTPAPEALTQSAPYHPGPVLGSPKATMADGERLRSYLTLPGATYPPPAGFYAPTEAPTPVPTVPAGQGGGAAPMGRGVMASAPVTQPATPTGKPLALGDPLRAKMSAPAVAPPPAASDELPDLTPEQYAEIAIASGDPAMMAWGKAVLEQANLKDTLGAKRQENDAKAKSDAEKQKIEIDKFGHEQRDKFLAIPAVRSALDSRAALEKVIRAGEQKSPMGDIAMVYGVITAFDPKSGVKEGEIALSSEAQGYISKLESMYERLKSGTRLTDDVRRDIIATAKNMYMAQKAPALQLANEYAGYLERAGLNPKNYLPDLGFSSTPKEPPERRTIDGKTYTKTDKGWVEG